MVYDNIGRLIESKNSRGGITKYFYYYGNNIISIINYLGNKVTMVYDLLNRITQVIDAKGVVIEKYE